MTVQVLQHVPFEGLGSIQPWMDARGITVQTTRLFEKQPFPLHDRFDWLIVMGGPMSVNDDSSHPWLAPEKRLILQAVDAGKTVLGVCLGAQLIASALGARVFPNDCKEIGWFPVHKTRGNESEFACLFEEDHEVFHWHGDTFDLPRGAVGFLESDSCVRQAFSIGRRVLGLQFHLEMTPASAASLIESSRSEIAPSSTVQTEEEMLARSERFFHSNTTMDSVLELMARPA